MFERPGLVAPDRLRRAYGSHRRGPSANPDPARSQGRKRAAQAAQPSDSENARDRCRRAERVRQVAGQPPDPVARARARVDAAEPGAVLGATARALHQGEASRRHRAAPRDAAAASARDDARKLRRAAPQIEEDGEHVDAERRARPARAGARRSSSQLDLARARAASGRDPGSAWRGRRRAGDPRRSRPAGTPGCLRRRASRTRDRRAGSVAAAVHRRLLVHARERAAVQTPVQIEARCRRGAP